VRLVFFGTPPVAVPTLDALIAGGHEVTLVVTRPDRAIGRSGRLQPPPVKQAASRLGLPVFQPTRVRNAAFLERIRLSRPEILVVVAYGRILPLSVLDLPHRGAVNIHFSLLPAYRGAAPVQWALAHGDRVTGVTTMQLSEGMDEGGLLLQDRVEIEPTEHTPQLQSRLAELGAALLLRTLDELSAGRLVATPQEHALATHAPPLRREDGFYDPAHTAGECAGRIRGFDPWPGLWFRVGGKRMRMLQASAEEGEALAEPSGSVVECTAQGLLISCAGGSRLRLSRLQPEGRKAVSARDAVNGRQLRVGDRIERPAE